MKVYGYVRVSTMKQNIERQIRNIKAEYPDAVIVTDEYTGTKMDRPGWMKLLRSVKRGDMVVFDSVSRMSRNADEGFQIYEELYRNGVELVFLKERHIDTAVYRKALENSVPMTGTNVDLILKGINDYLLCIAKEQIKLVFAQAEKEAVDLHERTREGMKTAKLNGKRIGTEAGSTLTNHRAAAIKELIQKYSRDFDGGLNDVDMLAMLAGKTVTFETPAPTKSDPGRMQQVTKSAKIDRGTFYKYKRELKAE